LQIYTLTRIPPDRQKVMMPGGALKDDLSRFRSKITPGKRIMVMGTPEEAQVIIDTGRQVVFIEDLPPEQQNVHGYPAGLVNIGSTCYMNASLQSLRAIPELKSSLLNFVPNDTDLETGICNSARSLFSQLENSNAPVNPDIFWFTFTDVFQMFREMDQGKLKQHDAEEFYTQFLTCMRKLPPITNSIPGNNLVEQLFTGEMVEEMRCLESDAEPVTSNTITFEKLPCHIGNETNSFTFSLENSMKEIIVKNAPSLERDAQFEKISRISRLPYYVTVQFVRFYWKKKAGIRNKIVKPLDFPFDLDLYPYCSQDLKDRVAQNRTDNAPPNPPYENCNGRYELIAVISHKGRGAEGGHYVGWVRDEQDENMWLQYDDDNVTVKDREFIKKLYGTEGADWHIAYMCIYRTKK